MQAIAEGNMATARWWADRKMREEGFGQQVAHVNETPPDPAQKVALQKLVDFFHRETMRPY